MTYIAHVEKTWPISELSANLGIPGYSKETPYNFINLGFWNTTGTYDAAKIWSDPISYFTTENPFGNTKDTIQKALIDKYHQKNIKVLISAFGETSMPTTDGLSATSSCEALA